MFQSTPVPRLPELRLGAARGGRRSFDRPPRWNGAFVGAVLLAVLIALPALSVSHTGSAASPVGSMARGIGLPTFGVFAQPSVGSRSSHVAAPRPLANNSTVVDPYAYYGFTGPAPYGITDFGVAANDSGYRYNTTSFLGNLDIGAMSASASVVYKGHTYVFPGDTVQLNVILVLSNGTQSAEYWVQNVPFFGPPNDFIDLEDNVWNMSGGGALPANTIVGNGSINSGSVYIASAVNQPGNNLSLGFPVNVSVKLVTGTDHGIPYVRFDYEDGFGWQTYDNASFPWAHGGWRDDGFVVDGTQYLPNGLFYDAEWVYGGPGNGLSSDNLQSNFTMGLEYWNGHNYQAVPNAFNFGSDTGESMHNVSESTGLGTSAGGLPSATVTVGNSPLGMLYSRADVAIVNVTSPLSNAVLTFGSLSVPFTGKDANVTLAPGSYEVRLWSGSIVVANGSISVVAGEYLALNLSTAFHPSSVSFASSGLPAGLDWSLVIGDQTYRSTGATLTLELVNGSYTYSIVPIPGYFVTQYRWNAPSSWPGRHPRCPLAGLRLPHRGRGGGVAFGSSLDRLGAERVRRPRRERDLQHRECGGGPRKRLLPVLRFGALRVRGDPQPRHLCRPRRRVLPDGPVRGPHRLPHRVGRSRHGEAHDRRHPGRPWPGGILQRNPLPRHVPRSPPPPRALRPSSTTSP